MSSQQSQSLFNVLILGEQNDGYEEYHVYESEVQRQVNDQNEKMIQQNKEKQELQALKPTGISNEELLSLERYPQPLLPYERPPQPKLRAVCYLQSSEETDLRRRKSIKGESYETQNIGKHLKSITMNFLLMLNQVKFLNTSEVMAMNIFNATNGSIKDFQDLFQVQQLRIRCQDFYSSKNYVIWVLNQSKMDIHSKLMMIKYAEKLRSIAFVKIKNWKIEA